MPKDKNLISGNTDMLILMFLSKADMYGYQIIEVLAQQSNNVFALKAGTLYPLLHQLESKRYVESYDKTVSTGKTRKYYHVTEAGHSFLEERTAAWDIYASAINNILYGGVALEDV